jgi:NAD(P)H-flavin reductase
VTNTYLPRLATITDIMDEATGARDVKTFRLKFDDGQGLDFLPGQFVLVSIFGKGEATFAVSSSSAQKEYIEVSVTQMGKVTKALHESEVGEKVGVRGPYGNSFDVDAWQGKNIILIGGGIGMAPLRPPLYSVLENRDKYGDLVVIYGARTTKDLCYLDELRELNKRDDVDVHMSIDVEEEGWDGFVGFVPTNLMEVNPGSDNAIAVTCGPPIMIKFVIENLLKLGFTDEQIFTTLEMRMKCGIGKCGRCNIGKEYVCKDGPVFSYVQLKSMQGER